MSLRKSVHNELTKVKKILTESDFFLYMAVFHQIITDIFPDATDISALQPKVLV